MRYPKPVVVLLLTIRKVFLMVISIITFSAVYLCIIVVVVITSPFSRRRRRLRRYNGDMSGRLVKRSLSDTHLSIGFRSASLYFCIRLRARARPIV